MKTWYERWTHCEAGFEAKTKAKTKAKANLNDWNQMAIESTLIIISNFQFSVSSHFYE